VLVADPDASLRRHVARALADEPIELVTCEGAESAVSILRGAGVEVAYVSASILDAGGRGLADLLAGVDVVLGVPPTERVGDPPAFVLSTSRPEPSAAAFAIRRALEVHALRAEARRARVAPGPSGPSEIVAATKSLRALVARASRVGPSLASVLVLGEPGTGKETLARHVHAAGQRGELVVVDLSELSAEEADRELGVDEGPGLDAFRRAESATLLLLHVEKLSPAAQAALLARLASPRGVRILATADPSIREAQRAGAFDPRLFVALSAVLLEIPPLRRRRDEIPVLASHFLHQAIDASGLDRRLRIGSLAMRALRRAPWPLNVAELRAAMTHAALVAKTDTIVPGDLPEEEGTRRTLRAGLGEEPYAAARIHALRQFERAYVEELLERTGNNIAQAAREAGMDRANFRRLLKRARSDPKP
jgi:DNA-binding NtrC family response regulator